MWYCIKQWVQSVWNLWFVAESPPDLFLWVRTTEGLTRLRAVGVDDGCLVCITPGEQVLVPVGSVVSADRWYAVYRYLNDGVIWYPSGLPVTRFPGNLM